MAIITGADPARLLTTYNNITTTNDITHCASLREQQQCLMESLCEAPLDPEAVASPSGRGQKAFGSVIPPDWAHAKLDLFDNTPAQMLAKNKRQLKLALAVLPTQDQTWRYFRASLNGPWRNVKRGLDFADANDRQHYSTIERVRDDYVEAGLVPRTSKFYRRGEGRKGESAWGLSVAVAELPEVGQYLATIIYERETYAWLLTNQLLTPEQRHTGIVASSRTQTVRQRVRARDLFR